MTRKGLFISIEGGEKAGKTTQARLLADWLAALGHEVVLTREPGGTPLGEAIREILLGRADADLDPVGEALLFAASRRQLVVDVIRPALDAGKVVVADRYVDSSLAYQAFGLGLPWDHVLTVNEWATGGLWPDLTVLLDTPDYSAFAPRPRGGSADRIEKRHDDFHRRVGEGFREIAKRNPERYAVIDGSKAIGEVAEAIRAEISTRLARRLSGREVPGQ